jgi:hypothetical protein
MTIKILPFLCLFGTSQIVAQLPKTPSVLQMQAAEQQREIRQRNAQIIQQSAQAHTPRQQQRQQVQEFYQEQRQEFNVPSVAYEFPENKTPQSQNFKSAATELTAMLEGKQTLSLRRAVFLSENAFFDNTLDYERFSRNIDMEVDIIQAFMKKGGYASDDDMAKKFFIQRLLSDTLVMTDAKGKVQFTHLPYRYDFDDPFGTKDPRKLFVTKLLTEKSGQCRSLPLLYLMLAEALDVKAWLAYAPQHSYIKMQDKKGAWHNYETTNGHYSSDSWLLSSGYISANALKNRIFMDTVSTKQTVAACLADLAGAYTRRFDNDKFVLDCLDKSLSYYPNNIQALERKSMYHTNLFKFVVEQLNNPPPLLLPYDSKAFTLYNQMHTQYKVVDKTGYQFIPDNVYKDWLKSFEMEHQKREIKAIRP